MVLASRPWLGVELHGRRGADPHVPGDALRCLQVSPRDDLDSWRVPGLDGARHGVHRPGPALRPGRVLGTRHWRVDRRPGSALRPTAGSPADRRSDYRGRDALAILRAP